MGKLLARLARGDEGASALEFALVLPVFCAMLFGSVQMGLALYYASSVQFALERTARITMIDQDMSGSEVQSAFADELAAFTDQSVPLTYTVDTSGDVPVAHLSATYSHAFVVPFVPEFSFQFPMESRVPLTPPSGS